MTTKHPAKGDILMFVLAWFAGAMLHAAVAPLCHAVLETAGNAWPMLVLLAGIVVFAFHRA